MTMTAEREADAPPDDFDFHRAELAAITGRGAAKRQVRYAYTALGQPDKHELADFLEAHSDTPPSRSTVYAELKLIRAESGHPDTGTLAKLTDETIARLDAERAASKSTSERDGAVSESGPSSESGNRVQSESGESVRVQSDPASELDSDSNLDSDTPNSDGPDSGPDLDATAGLGLDGPAEAGPVVIEPVPEFDGKDHAVTVPLEVVQPESEPSPVRLVDSSDLDSDADSIPDAVQPASEQAPETGSEQGEKKLSPWVMGGCYVVALATLPISVNTSWRFFEKVMHITERTELFGMAAVMEMALVMCGIGMATSVRKFGDPGAFRLIVWGICLFSGWTAWHMSDTLGEALARMVLGPVLGAVMLHLALGLIRRTHHNRTGTLARVGRELRERALSRLGLADDARTAAQRTRDRAATRAVELSMPGRWRFSRKAKLQRALLAAGVADDPQMLARLLARRKVVQSADELAGLDQGSAWG